MADENVSEDASEARTWLARIKAAERQRETWVTRCDKIVKRYRDERSEKEKDLPKFNVLWANVQTMCPALYGRTPTPVVERRFLDRDDIGRIASQILERALKYELEDSGFHSSVEKGVLDYQLAGQGVLWVRYEPYFSESSLAPDLPETAGDKPDDAALAPAAPQAPQQVLESECTNVDQVHWKDFLTGPARCWDELTWVGRRVYMDRDALVKRFGKVGEGVTLDRVPEEVKGADQDDPANKQATVYEIWDKSSKTAMWFAKEGAAALDKKTDPLKLKKFWPCAEPILTTTANDSLIPVPDYAEYQDQADEIDELTQRIALLESALKVSGCFNSAVGELSRLLDDECENTLIPVDNWAMFAEKGGLQGAISFLPIAEIAVVLKQLLECREQVKRDLHEITGIADIIRGQSDPDETLGAQKLKGQYVNLRLQKRQRDVASWCRDTIGIMGEIISEHFSPKTLIDISGAMYDDGLVDVTPQQALAAAQQQGLIAPPQPPAPAMPGQPPAPVAPPQPPDPKIIQFVTQQIKQQQIDQALQLLRSDKTRGFRIDIETDSTIETDAQEEKQSRVEFMGAVAGFLKTAGEMAAAQPKIVPLLGKILLFGVRGFRTARDLEASIENFVDQAEQQVKASEGQPPKPDPEQAKAQAAIASAQIQAKSEETNAQLGIQAKQLDAQVAQMKAQAEMARIDRETEASVMEHQMRMAEMSGKQQMAREAQQAKALSDLMQPAPQPPGVQ